MAKSSQKEKETQEHYSNHPFDFLDGLDLDKIDEMQKLPFKRFVRNYLLAGQRVIDVGCGPGRDSLFLNNYGVKVFSVDISLPSLLLAETRVPGISSVCASNLKLPFRDMTFDAVVSDGVIHHTPDARKSFMENARILKKGGYMYVAVYRRWRYYFYLYTYAGVPVRWLANRRWGLPIVLSSLLPLYFMVHLIKSRGRRSWRGAKNLFYDYMLTPRATFHTREELVMWGKESGLTLVDYNEKGLGNCHAFVFRKDEGSE